jgi:hypothetical protein
MIKEDLPLYRSKGKRIIVPKNKRKKVICMAGKLLPTRRIEVSHKALKRLAHIIQNIPCKCPLVFIHFIA